MGDHLRTGKPSVHVISQLGRLSLLSSVGRLNEYQPCGWVIINGDAVCGEWQADGLTAQVDWLGQRVGSQLVPNYIHRMNRANSHNARPGIRQHYKYHPHIIIINMYIVICASDVQKCPHVQLDKFSKVVVQDLRMRR